MDYLDQIGTNYLVKAPLLEYDPNDYLSNQCGIYTTALANGNQQAALDALWRAASHSNLLPEGKQWIEADEARHYTRRLGWPEI